MFWVKWFWWFLSLKSWFWYVCYQFVSCLRLIFFSIHCIPVVASVVELGLFSSPEILRELCKSIRCFGHGKRIRDDTTDTTGEALMVNCLGPVSRLLSVHSNLVRCGLWFLQLYESSNVVGLTAHELLFGFFDVHDWCVEASHLLLSQRLLAKGSGLF